MKSLYYQHPILKLYKSNYSFIYSLSLISHSVSYSYNQLVRQPKPTNQPSSCQTDTTNKCLCLFYCLLIHCHPASQPACLHKDVRKCKPVKRVRKGAARISLYNLQTVSISMVRQWQRQGTERKLVQLKSEKKMPTVRTILNFIIA